jgi:hypothetical protein
VSAEPGLVGRAGFSTAAVDDARHTFRVGVDQDRLQHESGGLVLPGDRPVGPLAGDGRHVQVHTDDRHPGELVLVVALPRLDALHEAGALPDPGGLVNDPVVTIIVQGLQRGLIAIQCCRQFLAFPGSLGTGPLAGG